MGSFLPLLGCSVFRCSGLGNGSFVFLAEVVDVGIIPDLFDALVFHADLYMDDSGPSVSAGHSMLDSGVA